MKVLVTGGAGFIGSHIVEALKIRKDVSEIRVLDNLSTGHYSNIKEFVDQEKVKFIEGDIRNADTCVQAVEGIDIVCHQAALGSVPRSIQDPITSHEVNVNGFLNILNAARTAGVKKMVYASSSSVYGDLNESPKVEERTGKLLSPYAATKMANELYAEVFAKSYGMQICGFRYFNVFGPRQDPNGPYAAVIPLFFKAALEDKSPKINGDGTITRDFTYVKNVVKANLAAMLEFEDLGKHHVFNIACGETTSLNRLWSLISEISHCRIEPEYGPVRKGDILHSLADVSRAQSLLGYNQLTSVREGLELTVEWYKSSSIA
jgi:UDP-N-acetylglucosamine 4-epimerase